MTPEQLHILQHTLGLDEFGLGSRYRNHYVGGIEECTPLVALGYMIQMKPRTSSGGDVWFMVTKEGIEAVRKDSPRPQKPTRSQQRFRDYLDFSDAYDCTFQEFLQIQKTDWYKRLKAGLPA